MKTMISVLLVLSVIYLPVSAQIIEDFLVSTGQENGNQFLSSMAVNDSGDFVISWVNQIDDNFKVYAKQFKNDGTTIDSSFLVSEEDRVSFYFTWSAVAMDGEGKFNVLWHGFEGYDYNMYVQRFKKDGEKNEL